MKKRTHKKSSTSHFYDKVAGEITKAVGRPITTIIAILIIVIWGLTGSIFNYSDTWQLVINTGTTIITFIMVFIIQQTQNKDTLALHLKLNELIASSPEASNRLIDSEDLTEEELEEIKKFYIRLSGLAKKHNLLFTTHSIDEADKRHERKLGTVAAKEEAIMKHSTKNQ
jgi:low affinity Fe/Cu permease